MSVDPEHAHVCIAPLLNRKCLPANEPRLLSLQRASGSKRLHYGRLDRSTNDNIIKPAMKGLSVIE